GGNDALLRCTFECKDRKQIPFDGRKRHATTVPVTASLYHKGVASKRECSHFAIAAFSAQRRLKCKRNMIYANSGETPARANRSGTKTGSVAPRHGNRNACLGCDLSPINRPGEHADAGGTQRTLFYLGA